jgi:DEAD/DEAH box helicase/Helicase conserved C-terminal domain
MPSNFVNPNQLVEKLADHDFVTQNAFEITQYMCNLAGQDYDPEAVQELVLRLLEHRDRIGTCASILDALVRELGLFPFLSPDTLGLADSLAYEFHRPESMGSGVVFHRPQAKVYRELVNGKNVVLSAPTSFGKSLIIDAIVNTGKFKDILIIVPTIALIDETRRRLSQYETDYKIITHPSQSKAAKNIFVLTQERALELEDLDDIGFFVVDEFYKLSFGGENEDRAALLNQAFYKLAKKGKQFYMLGPHIDGLTKGLDKRLHFEFMHEPYHTVVSQLHRIGQWAGEDEFKRLTDLCRQITGPTLIFCSSPDRAAKVARALVEANIGEPCKELKDAVEWISEHYHPDWHVPQALAHGIGVHHGRIPRALSQFMVRSFDAGNLSFLICTSTLIEGVNTKAENIIIFDNKIAKEKYDYFTFNNIRGRSGRMFKHFVGHVYLFHEPPPPQLPLVDIPAYTQPDSAPDSLLIQLEDEDLTPHSRNRLKQYADQDLLSLATLRANNGIDPDGQLGVARSILDDLRTYHLMLNWRGMPTWEQLEFISNVIWNNFNGLSLAQRTVRTAKQLAYLVNQLRSAPTTRLMIEARMNNDDADAAVTSVLDFTRLWAMFHFPRLLRAVERIQLDVFRRHNLQAGDYSVFASHVENLFLDGALIALDEYGVPIELARKLESRLSTQGDLDATLVLLKSLNLAKLNLSPFEREILQDAQDHLGNIF